MRITSLACLILLTVSSLAQKPTAGAERSAWYMYFGDHPITPSWGVHLEGQYRREGLGQRSEQLLLRPGVNYDFGHGVAALFAYTYLRNYPFEGGGIEANGPQPEHRILEQLKYQHTLGSSEYAIRLEHRFRLEQRFQGTARPGLGVINWQFAERARYRLTANIPFRWNTAGALPDYASIYDEIFFNSFGPHSGPYIVPLNRVYGALGWNLNQYFQLEAGYLFQSIPTPNGVVGSANHALQITINSKAPFRRGIRKKK